MKKIELILIVFFVVSSFSQTTNDDLSKELLELEKKILTVDSNYLSIAQKLSELRKLIEQVPTYAEFNKLAQDVNIIKIRQDNLEKSYQTLLKEVENLKKELTKANSEIAKLKSSSVKTTTESASKTNTENENKGKDLISEILGSDTIIYVPVILFFIVLVFSFL